MVTVSRYSYLTTDLLTDRDVAEIPFQSEVMDQTMNGYGECRGSVDLRDDALKGIDVKAALTPDSGRLRALYVLRDDVIVWGGIIWRATRTQSSRRVQVQAYEVGSYFDRRLVTEDVHGPLGRLAAARLLISTMQAEPNGSLRIRPTDTDSDGSEIHYKLWRADLLTVGEALAQIAENGEDPFDWRIDTQGDSDNRARYLRLGRPLLGRSAAQSRLVFESPGNITEWTDDLDAWSDSATQRWEVGAEMTPDDEDDTDDPLIVRVTDDAALDAGAPLVQTAGTDWSEEDNREALRLRARDYQAQRGFPVETFEVEVTGDDPEIGSYLPGDEARFIVRDDWHKPLSNGEASFDRVLRIYAMSITPDTDRVQLTVGEGTRRQIVRRRDKLNRRLAELERRDRIRARELRRAKKAAAAAKAAADKLAKAAEGKSGA